LSMLARIFALLAACLAAACGTAPMEPSKGHVQAPAPRTGTIPPPVGRLVIPPPPKPTPRAERYTVVVNNVAVRELLFAVARDAKVNVDIHPGIQGNVTLNAVDQTLPQILARIAKQVDMRFELDGANLSVMPDTPYLRSYKIDYVNIARTASGSIGTATQVAGASTQANNLPSGSFAGNVSGSNISFVSNNKFWETLIQNVKDLLRETDKVFPEGTTETQVEQRSATQTSGTGAPYPPGGKAPPTLSTSANPAQLQEAGSTVTRKVTYREAASVIANPEAGILSVRANSRQHERVQEFLDQVLGSARRQVLIEATIVEVLLNDEYQAGVDWSRLPRDGTGISFGQNLLGANLATAPNLTIGYIDPSSSAGNISATIRALSRFGNTRVLSSPKITALNNQTAVLKVVEERVYFTVEVKITESDTVNRSRTDVTSTPHTVPVGLIMTVTPQIAENNEVSLIVRPTISRITGFVIDPGPRLSGANFDNRVPEIQVREMESLLRVANGEVIVMGGLMQDSVERSRDGIPGLSKLPVVGDVFSFRNDKNTKSELVIFLRPVVSGSGAGGDLRAYRELTPRKAQQ
jgi:MSHA biogenesis protein MshL